MDRFLIAILLSSFSLAFYCNGSQKGFEHQKAQTVAPLKAQLALAEKAKTAADLRSLLSADSANKEQEDQAGKQVNEKTQGEKSPTHRQLSVRGYTVKLFNYENTVRLLVGTHNDRLIGDRLYGPNELVVLEVDQENKKENVIASAPVGGDLKRMELYSDSEGQKIRTLFYHPFEMHNHNPQYNQLAALTLKPVDSGGRTWEWSDYSTISRGEPFKYERHIVSTIGGKKKRITLCDKDQKLRMMDVDTEQCEYEYRHSGDSDYHWGMKDIHVIDSPSSETASASAAAQEATSAASSTKDAVKRPQRAIIVSASTRTEFTLKPDAPSEEAYLKEGHSCFEYKVEFKVRKDFLCIEIFDMHSRKIEKHVIPDVDFSCSARFPNDEGSKIIFACRTKNKKQVYKLVVFDPVTKTHKLFEKVDPNLYTYDLPEDISCVKTPEGKNLVALARGPDIFMIDLN